MILIQLILILGFLITLRYFLSQTGSMRAKAWQKIAAVSFVFMAIAAILLPDRLNDLAEFVGVTRGADLLLYLLATASIFSFFSGYAEKQQERDRMVRLVRRIALIEAEEKYGQKRAN